MARRQLGHGRGGRMKIETDRAFVTAGVRHGRTLGGPVALQVANRDYTNWDERMSPWPVDAEVPEAHLPRPGHADLVGAWKYGHTDIRNVLERASARETAARVAGGAVCRAYLAALGVGGSLARRADRDRRGAGARGAAGRRGLRRGRREPGPLPRRRVQPRDGRAHQQAAQGQRVDRRRVRGDRVRRCCPASARTSPGRRGSTAASRARSARSRPSRASTIGDAFEIARSRAPRRTTRSSTTRRAATTARRIAPAASRAE